MNQNTEKLQEGIKNVTSQVTTVTSQVTNVVNKENLDNATQMVKDQMANAGQIGQQVSTGIVQAGTLIKNTSSQAFEKAGDIIEKSGELYNQGEQKLHAIEDKLSDIESDIEDKFEEAEETIKHHSKKLRFVAAVFFFPIWFSFYNFVHTTLATWDIFAHVYSKIDKAKTKLKIIYTLSMCCVGCGAMQMLLFIMSFVHLDCAKFKQEPSLQIAFRNLAYEPKCETAMKIEQSLLVFFGDYTPINSKDMIEMQNMSKVTVNKSKTFTEKKANQDLEQQLLSKD